MTVLLFLAGGLCLGAQTPKAEGIDWSKDPLAQVAHGDNGVLDRIAGSFTHEPEDADRALSPAAKALIREAFSDIPPGALRDFHTHLIAFDPVKTKGGYVHPKGFSARHPLARAQIDIYRSAAGVRDLSRADEQYVDRLVRLIRNMPDHGKSYLLAFDQAYDVSGQPRPDPRRLEQYVPNDYAVETARRYSDVFVPAISVHPLRPDAVAEIERWAAQGVRLIKWLPNAQNIPVDDPRLDPFYRKVRDLGMTLLVHTGEEQALGAPGPQQSYGNPLRLRRALNLGARVIMAHCASLGTDADLDDPGRRRVPSYQLALRMLRDPKYRGLLYADISAMAQANRIPKPLLAVLAATDVHESLVNGSDYPLPAVNILIRLKPLARSGLIEAKDVVALREIYGVNPLLFDFVLKRCLRDPQTGARFPASVFIAKPGLGAD